MNENMLLRNSMRNFFSRKHSYISSLWTWIK